VVVAAGDAYVEHGYVGLRFSQWNGAHTRAACQARHWPPLYSNSPVIIFLLDPPPKNANANANCRPAGCLADQGLALAFRPNSMLLMLMLLMLLLQFCGGALSSLATRLPGRAPPPGRAAGWGGGAGGGGRGISVCTGSWNFCALKKTVQGCIPWSSGHSLVISLDPIQNKPRHRLSCGVLV